MDFFDRHKALIITILFISVLILGLYNFNLSNNNQKAREFLMDLESLDLEKPQEQETEPEKEEISQKTRESIKTHRAFNQDQESRDANFDQQLNEIFQKNSSSQEETADESNNGKSGDYSVREQIKPETKKRSDGNNNSEITSTKMGGIDNSSISFSLKGRTAREIPNPIYTCDRPGKIVVNISVNESGVVTSTTINKASSTSSNECLTEQAMQYAAQAVFSSLPGRTSQPGTITYHFKS